MTRIPTKDYIDKIIFLEKKIGERASYKILDPFAMDPNNIIDVQNAAKKLAHFIGLSGFTFIVAKTKQKENTAGNIELDFKGKEVFVEISDELISGESMLAVLSHEITHKYLDINNISCGRGVQYTYENEILTDIASIYLGMGKILLNGCEHKNISYEIGSTRTKTSRYGYLNKEQLAFVYSFICTMRGLSAEKCEEGLSQDALQSVNKCKSLYRDYLDINLCQNNAEEKLIKDFYSNIDDTQLELSNIENDISYLKYTVIDIFEEFLKREHSKIRKTITEVEDKTNEEEYNYCLRYINAIQLKHLIEKKKDNLQEIFCEAHYYKDKSTELVDVARNVVGKSLSIEENDYIVVICRNDNTKIKIPAKKGELRVKCPNCNYKFTVNTDNTLKFLNSPKERSETNNKSEMWRIIVAILIGIILIALSWYY